MSRTATRPKDSAAAATEAPARRGGTTRELVEQIVVAFILAFLVRGFEAEAFVIPTGSMAPTLMGAHKDVECPQCGFVFTVNASEEFERHRGRDGEVERRVSVATGSCGNCRAPVRLGEAPTFNGDRILVMKSPLNLPGLARVEPKRWEVWVFHYPEEPETNFIKRLVGLPGEELRIVHGDVHTRPIGTDEPFRVLRKPLAHLDAMQMNVWDDAHRPRLLADRPEWRRWQADPAGSWSESQPGRFTSDGSPGGGELRYHHLVPDGAQWRALSEGKPLPYGPQPRLVADSYSYNTGSPYPNQPLADAIAPHWVGDIAVKCRVEVEKPGGALRIDLVEAGAIRRCAIDLTTGEARLYDGDTPVGPPAATAMKGTGGHDVRFANVDGRLTLWVDGATPFGDGVPIEDATDPQAVPTAEDLAPARIAAPGATVAVTGLVLSRDIYYTRVPGYWDYDRTGLARTTTLSDPADFPLLAQVDWDLSYPIRPGHFLMLGDNSPRSKDSRGWTVRDRDWDTAGDRQSWEVPESFLIGKAFFVYWPHGKPIWPSIAVNRDLRLPFRPNVERMKPIR